MISREQRDAMRVAAEGAKQDRDRVNEAGARGEKLWASIDIQYAFYAASCPSNVLSLLDALEEMGRAFGALRSEAAVLLCHAENGMADRAPWVVDARRRVDEAARVLSSYQVKTGGVDG